MQDETNLDNIHIVHSAEESAALTIHTNSSNVELTKLQCIKEILKITVPYSFNEVIVNGEFFVKTIFFSKIGSDELAAASLISTTQLLTIATAKAILISTNIYVARSSGNSIRIGSILRQSWLQATLQSVPLIIISSITNPIFVALGQPKTISDIASTYLLKSNISLPAMLLLHSNQMFSVGLKRPNLALTSTIISTSCSLLLSYLFAFGKIGLPNMGVTGIVVGTGISTWLTFAGMTTYMAFIDKQIRECNIFSIQCSGENFILTKMFTTGLPLGLNVFSEFGSYFLMGIMVGKLGKNSLIAEQISTQYSGILLAPIMATAMAVDVLVGHDISRNNSRNIKMLANIGLATGIAFSVCGLTLLCSAPKLLASPFLQESNESYDEIFSLVRMLFVVLAINNVGEAIRNTLSGALRGFYDTALPTIITTIMFWAIGLPTSYLLSFVIGLGINGVFIGRGFGIISTSAILLDRWRRKSDNPAVAIEEGETSLLTKFSIFCDKVKVLRDRYYPVHDNAADNNHHNDNDRITAYNT